MEKVGSSLEQLSPIDGKTTHQDDRLKILYSTRDYDRNFDF